MVKLVECVSDLALSRVALVEGRLARVTQHIMIYRHIVNSSPYATTRPGRLLDFAAYTRLNRRSLYLSVTANGIKRALLVRESYFC